MGRALPSPTVRGSCRAESCCLACSKGAVRAWDRFLPGRGSTVRAEAEGGGVVPAGPGRGDSARSVVCRAAALCAAAFGTVCTGRCVYRVCAGGGDALCRPSSDAGDVFPAVPAGGFCPVIEVVFLTVCPVTLRLCVVCVFACDMRVEDDAACVPAGPCLPPGVLTLSDRLRLAGEAGVGACRVPCRAAPFRFAPSLNVCCRITELLCDVNAALCSCEAVCTPPV